MIFSLMLVAGGGAIGGKEALRQCAPTGILPDRGEWRALSVATSLSTGFDRPVALYMAQ